MSEVKENSVNVTDILAEARRLLRAGQFEKLIEIFDNIPVDDLPEEALYLQAVSWRYIGNTNKALQILTRLLERNPTNARAYQETGHNYRLQNELQQAVSAYVKAVQANAALLASWKAIADLTDESSPLGQEARQRSQELLALPKELLSVESMMNEGKLFKAEQLCRSFLKKHPQNVDGMRLLARMGLQLNILDDAEFLLESALTFQPDHIKTRLDYITALHRRQKYEQSYNEAKSLFDTNPENPAFASSYANEALAIGKFDTAINIYDELCEKFPDLPGNHLVRGHALKTVGEQEKAISAYQHAYQVKPDFGDAYWSLANLKTYTFSNVEMKNMAEQEKSPSISLQDRYHLCFALGKAYEDQKDYKNSFGYYKKGNDLKQQEVRYSADRLHEELQRQKEFFTPELFQQFAGAGDTARDPIFIVGLPRAGSTLLEQILASHSQIDGTLELPNILALVHRLNGRRKLEDDPRYPSIINDLEPNKLKEFGKDYIEGTRVYRKQAPFFTDKMPNNFRHIGLIHLILPNAKIIDARRHPMACCFSGFKQLFAEGQEFTYGLEQVGRYYRDYVDLMAHWDSVLPGKVLRVQYEDVIDDIDYQVRRILDFCDLPFEEACIEFHHTKRSVRTASSEQVRQPLFKSGLDQWQHYEEYLGPLKEALGPVLEGYK